MISEIFNRQHCFSSVISVRFFAFMKIQCRVGSREFDGETHTNNRKNISKKKSVLNHDQ